MVKFSEPCKKIQNEKGVTIAKIGSNHDKEFENHKEENGIKHEFSTL